MMLNATTNRGDNTMANQKITPSTQLPATSQLSLTATEALSNLDQTFIGTGDYMGLAYFWNFEYRHYLCNASYGTRRHVHTVLLEAGLDVGVKSAAHSAIIYFGTVGRNGAGEILDEDQTIAYYKSHLPKSVSVTALVNRRS
jgi:hypothetical protein